MEEEEEEEEGLFKEEEEEEERKVFKAETVNVIPYDLNHIRRRQHNAQD